MLLLTLRTDKPEAEIGLYQDQSQIAYHVWQAHRQLAETIHTTIVQVLKKQDLDWQSLEGIVLFQGPGSFTGLRIGATVANALAAALSIPIVGARDDWIEAGIARLLAGENDQIVIPHYGAEPNTTAPRK